MSSNLMRDKPGPLYLLRRFCANPLNISKFASVVKLFFAAQLYPYCDFCSHRSLLRLKVTPRQISKIDQRAKHRATRAHERLTPGSCNGLFSAGFPTGVQGRLPHLTQRTCSITLASHFPQRGRPRGPPGGFTTHLQLFKSTTSYSLLQAIGF
jgi:hypothetical protein